MNRNLDFLYVLTRDLAAKNQQPADERMKPRDVEVPFICQLIPMRWSYEAMVVAQYYNFVRLGHDGYEYIMHTMQANSRKLAEDIAATGQFSIIGDEGAEQLPLVAFQLAEEQSYDEFDIAAQLASERGWMVPAYTLPPDADHIKIMRALVKETLGRSLATTLAEDIAQACATLRQKGRVHETERKRVHTSTGY